MMDMLVMALACDLTAVATFQWSDTEAKHTFPWLALKDHHHYYQHDGGFRPAECEKICTWYSQQHLYLLQQMAAVDMGGHTLLDESVVFFGSELQDPPSHRKTNMPFFLAGNGGGLRTGRWLNTPPSPTTTCWSPSSTFTATPAKPSATPATAPAPSPASPSSGRRPRPPHPGQRRRGRQSSAEPSEGSAPPAKLRAEASSAAPHANPRWER